MQRILQVLGSDVGSIVSDYLSHKEHTITKNLGLVGNMDSYRLNITQGWRILTTTREMPDSAKSSLNISRFLLNKLVWIGPFHYDGYYFSYIGDDMSCSLLINNKGASRIIRCGGIPIIQPEYASNDEESFDISLDLIPSNLPIMSFIPYKMRVDK